MTKFIDFNDLTAGTIVDNEYVADGVTISAVGGSNQAMIFDTANPTGGDHDLATSNLGNVLIISEDGDSHDPDDNAGGGKFIFNFDTPSTVESLTFLDTEESAWVKFFDINGNLIKTVDVHGIADNGQRDVDFNVDDVARMEVILAGSGAIDNLKFTPNAVLDGIVDGTNDGELIDSTYDGDPEGDKIDNGDAILPGEAPQDDIVDAQGGNDTINSGAGNDDVYAGGGDDKVDGGNGNDLIFGDSTFDGVVDTRESFNWEGLSDGQIDGGVTQNTGSVTVTYERTQDSGHHDSSLFDGDLNVSGIETGGEDIDRDSGLFSVTNGQGNEGDFKWTFSDAVENVEFNINDIDGDGVVTVKAFDVFGNEIPVQLQGGPQLTVSGNVADSNGGYSDPDTNDYNLQVTIPGPVAMIVVEHDQDGANNSGVIVTDIYFDVPDPEAAEPGDDMLNGGAGHDTIFGEDGNDTLNGGSGNDSLVGGDGDDRIFGGDGDDTQIGGDGNDTLGGADFGDDLFIGGAGDDMVEASFGNDTIDGGTGNDDLWASADDDLVNGGDGNDNIHGGHGRDTLFGDADDDTIYGGSNNDTIDGGTGNDELFGDGNFKDDNGPAGNDKIDGGEGNDTIDGMGGNDTLTGGEGDDSILGGADRDLIFGGAGDTVDGGAGGFNADPNLNSDFDILDLTGQGPFYLDNVTTDSNGNGIDGTVVFVDADGNPTGATISFTEIEKVVGEEINRGPDAVDDMAETDEDTAVIIDVLSNDSDPDGDPLEVISATSPNGTVEINPDGTLTFTPDENFNGMTTVDYVISDGNGGTDKAWVKVTVNSVNDAPDAVDDFDTTDEDTPITVDLLANDTDPDGDDLTVTSARLMDPTQGTLVNNGDGTVTFTPAPDFNGDVVIKYDITDGNGGRDWASHTITVEAVNDAPDATDDSATTDEDTPVTIPVLDNDSDPDGDPLTVTEATSPDGDVVINPDGTITFTPADNFNGPTTITYTVTDPDGNEDTATVNVVVNPVNDGPETGPGGVEDDVAETDEDTPVDIDVLANDSDPDGDPLTVTEATSPDGDVVINPDGTITFTPDENFNGETTITYTVEDPSGESAQATVTVTVNPINDAPEAVDDADGTQEDTAITVDLLANDFDVDGDDLTVIAVSVPADQGTVVNNGDGTATFTPAPNFNGEATISYTIEDEEGLTDSAIHTVDVAAVQDVPDAENDVATTDEDTPVTIDVLANDEDPDGDPLTVTEATSPDGDVVINPDGTITFTPDENFNGNTTIEYTITDPDGNEDTATVFVHVDPVNDAPEAVDDADTTDEDTPVIVDLLANDFDVDGDDLSVVSATLISGEGEIVDNGDGTVTFTPAPDFNGEAVIEYTIQDEEGLQDTALHTITVEGVEDAPDAEDDVAETDEDTPVTIDVLDNDSDPDGDPLTVTEATSPDGDVTINPDGTITFTPDENFNGDTTITYTVTDPDGNEDTATVDVTVNPINDAPEAVDDADGTQEDTAITVDLLANDFDVDGDDLTVIAVSVPADQGTVVNNGDGTATFTPAPNFNGEATISYTIEDEEGLTDSAIHTVDVAEVQDAPDAEDDVAETDEDTPVTIDVLGNDSDPDGDPLTVTEATSPDGDVVINPDGTITFTPDENFNGDTTIEYTITDPDGNEDTATVTVTVLPVNDAPEAEDDRSTTPFNTAVTVPVLANDFDVDGDDLTVTEATSPDGDVVINPDGTITFTPNDGFEGEAVIDYTIQDEEGLTDTAQVFITVEEQPLDGIVSGTDDGDLIDENYTGDPEGDMVDNNDEILPGEGPNDDIIQAGGGDDTIVAGEGDDDVFAGEGNDRVHGGPGDDILRGEEGDDTINAGAGDDTVLGGDDDDVINGGDGSDSIEGGDGNDLITSSDPDNDTQIDKGYPGLFDGEEGTPEAENERDFVDGGAGDDTISTGDDRDTVIGGTGNDVIDGGIDDDIIDGDDTTNPTEGGDDRIVGGEGNDLITGGVGNDTIYAGNDPDLGLDFLNIEDDGSNPFGPDLRPDNGRDTVDGGEGDDLIFGADDDDVLLGGEGNDTIDGEIDDDFIDGGIGDDSLLGGQGNDTIEGGDGNDFIDAGRNADSVDGGDGDDTIFGDNGADVLNGGEGNDLIDGGTGDDTLNGDGGDDTIIGSTGDDVIDGGAGNDLIDGGNGGSDIMSGGDDRDTFINVNAGEVVDGNEGGDDFDTLDLTGSAPNNGSLQVVLDPTNPENGVVNYFDQNGDPAGTLTFTNIENVIPCFTPGTLIATPTGERRVEELAVGDRVITRDNGIQEIRWVGQREMSGAELSAAPHLNPVLIRAGALGKGLPERDMLVSPQHRVLMSGDKTELYFDESEVLVAAKHLVGMDGIDVVEVSGTTYIHVMFDQHEVILSDGAWTESFQPGDQTLGAMGDAQRAEIIELFPELATAEGIETYAAARRSLKKHEAQLLT